MTRRYIPLKPLRAFEAAARHLSFTNAAIELNVTHSAISQQVKLLEEQLNCALFVRVPRGLLLTPEAENLLPVLNESFDRIAVTLDYFSARQRREKLKVGVVGTFASGLLLPALADFYHRFPHIDLQLSTHNNRVDLAAEGLDLAVRFGSGAWHGTAADFLCESPLSPLCTPVIAARLQQPSDVLQFPLLRSYRRDEWAAWLQKAGGPAPAPTQQVLVFDSSVVMLEAAMLGAGIAIVPPRMFRRLLERGAVVQPFTTEVTLGSYWLTRLQSRPATAASVDFASWLVETVRQSATAVAND